MMMMMMRVAGGGGFPDSTATVEHGLDILPGEEDVFRGVGIGQQEVAPPGVEVGSVGMPVLGNGMAISSFGYVVVVEDEFVWREEYLQIE